MLFLAMTAVKATLVLLVAFALAMALRRASAAVRHLMWTLVITGVLVLPILSLVLPRVPVMVRPVEDPIQQATITVTRTPTVPTAPTSDSRQKIVLYTWLAGVLIVSARLAIGVLRVWLSTRRATRMENPLIADISSQLALRRTVTVVTSDQATVPMAWGILKPVIVLPADSYEWPLERTRMVLSHELAHVKRQDCLIQTLSQIACALYWFHPLIWLAVKQLRKEREQACDDRVLSLGNRASDYARHLVELANSLRPAERQWPMAVAMAQPHEVEARVVSLLDPQRRRRTMTRMGATLCALATVAVILPLSTLRAPAQDHTGIGGSVYDASGAAVPEATVTVSNLDTGSEDATLTNAAGEYTFMGIPAGRYLMKVQMAGFAIFRQQDVKLTANSPVRLDPILEIGGVSESLEVVGQAHRHPQTPLTSSPRRIRVGGNIQATKLTYQVKPIYTETLQQQGIEGTVLLRAVITKEGSLHAPSIVVISTLANPELAKAAIDAVKQWRYEPTLLNGEPVEVATTITMHFKLQ
jgi:TonB family protein